MSHVCKIELMIRDLDALEAACKEIGLELVRNQDHFKWFGRSVGDYPIPEGFTAEDMGKCQHAIRIPGNKKAYEIGITQRRDGKPGFQLLWDFWAGGYGLREVIGEDGNRLRQAYAAAVATKAYSKLGYRVTRSTRADGRIIMEATR